VSRDEIEKIREELIRPVSSEGELTPRGFEDEVREIVTGSIGFRRDEKRLESALMGLSELKSREGSVWAANYHDLMRFYEAKNLRTVAETIAACALERCETRGGGAHVRMDYPERDDASGPKMILVKKDSESGELKVSAEPTGLDIEVTPESKTVGG
jgi:succinate dehydrogenase/fumarate reductase flavoprotein subunit